ncbi:hypothetical protein [Pseudoalteromonas sp. SR43-2]|uniref:hypothetical protein n=1 Tax=Pseudoalteromonas sp. SR43-2 TaxID=2760944 RepID=UPI0015F89C91|nr:hypothetical protein [Pseudoalteromonas sp. SR43-2]MBB1378783.1 hypothetical protein [Pseudoalteromonas sp. SR43-2]
MSKRKNERSLIPLMTVIGLVSVPLIYILGIATGSQIQLSSIFATDSLSSWVAALATVAIAVLTFILAKETWYLREAQIEQINSLRKENIRPAVSVTLKNSDIAFNLMMVNLSNLGKGIARNISFKFIDKSGTEISEGNNVIVDLFLNLHVFSNGMHSLGINQSIDSFLFSFYDLKGKLEDNDIFTPFFTIIVSYSDVEGNIYTNELTIDFAEFKGITEIGGGNPLHKMAEDLKKLREQIEKMTSSSPKKLHVNTYTSRDREEQQKADAEWYAERMKQ